MAGPTRASGHPDYSSTSASGFIPQIWSGKMVEKLYPSTVFGEIANTDYEGEIKAKGDTVIIRTTPSITIRDYDVGGGLQTEKPTSGKVVLPINNAKYFNFEVEDVDAYQSDIKLMDDWANDAGEQMAITIDSQILSEVYTDVSADNAGVKAGAKSASYNMGATGSPVLLDKSNIVDFIVDTGSVLFEENVPTSNRWIVLPIWACNLIKKSELKDASLSGDGTSMLRNGRIGMIDNYTVYASNNLSTVSDGGKQVTNMIFGHKKALTFASQMTKMEDLRNPNDFGDLVRGLNVFGYKVIDPKAMGHGYIAKA